MTWHCFRNNLGAGNGVDDHPQLRCGSCQTETVWTVAFYRVNCQPFIVRPRKWPINVFFFWFRYPTLIQQETVDPGEWTTEQLQALPSPRVIKSHLPFYLLPPRLVDTCKVLIDSIDLISLIWFDLNWLIRAGGVRRSQSQGRHRVLFSSLQTCMVSRTAFLYWWRREICRLLHEWRRYIDFSVTKQLANYR